jgi:hypothetical protein
MGMGDYDHPERGGDDGQPAEEFPDHEPEEDPQMLKWTESVVQRAIDLLEPSDAPNFEDLPIDAGDGTHAQEVISEREKEEEEDEEVK